LSYFSWCIREGLLETNPSAWTERREEVARGKLLSDDELREIWSALRGDAYGDIVRLLILTGARREEIGALRWSEINLDHHLIALSAKRTKNHRPHEIFLSPPALALLQARPRLTWPDGSLCDLVFGRGARGFSGWVAAKTALDGRISRRWHTAVLPPMPQWTLHDFRRLVSTTMHDQLGVQPHIVEAVLGHVGHQGGTAGRYNLASYRADKAAALLRWSEHVLAVAAGTREQRVGAATQSNGELRSLESLAAGRGSSTPRRSLT